MSGETIFVRGTPKVLEANGALIANNALAQADDSSYDAVADGNSYPHAEFVIVVTFATAPVEGTSLALYARPLDIEGTTDAEAPETSRPSVVIGTFTVNNVTTQQAIVMNCIAFDVPVKADYYVHNNGTGQSVSAGWKLTLIPRTYKAAA